MGWRAPFYYQPYFSSILISKKDHLLEIESIQLMIYLFFMQLKDSIYFCGKKGKTFKNLKVLGSLKNAQPFFQKSFPFAYKNQAVVKIYSHLLDQPLQKVLCFCLLFSKTQNIFCQQGGGCYHFYSLPLPILLRPHHL